MVQAHSAWCSALSRGSPLTQTRRHFVHRFPRSQDEDSIFRMGRYASLNPCGGLSHRCHTGTRVWQYEGSTSVEDHNVAFLDHSLHCKQTLADLGSKMSLGLRCHLPPCRSVRTFTVNSPRLSIFSPPAPTYRCPFTEPFDGFKSIFGQSSWFHN